MDSMAGSSTPWWPRRFADPAMERSFLDREDDGALPTRRAAAAFGGAIFAVLGVVDPIALPAHYRSAWTFRFGVFLPATMLAVASSFLPGSASKFRRAAAPFFVAAASGLIAMMAHAQAGGSLVYSCGITLVFALMIGARLPARDVALAVVLVIAGYLGTLVAAGRFLDPVAACVALVVVASAGGAVVAAASGEAVSRRAFATQRSLERALGEVKTLTGLVPICAWCKQVRDDRGYWQAIEHYVASKTTAEFSHGICPHCSEAHFAGEGHDQAPGER